MEATIHRPPRLLLGATLLFWGAMSGHPLIGLVLALLVEGANWIRFRWDFDIAACSFAWRISVGLSAIAGALIWLDGDRYTALPKILVWMPALLFPLQFVQSYGLRNQMPLTIFSFLNHLHSKRDRRPGLANSDVHFNFGNPFFVVAVVASSLGVNAQQAAFLPGLVILGGWLVYSRMKARPIALVTLLLIAALIGLGGQIGMRKLYNWTTNRSTMEGISGTDPTANRTSIGSLGRIKQSPGMLWRLKVTDGSRVPRLLRLASYNHYKGVTWRNVLREVQEENAEVDSDFRNFGQLELEDIYYPLRENMNVRDLRKPLPSFQLRGATRSEAPLPLPGSAGSLHRFELEAVDVNPLGTVRVFPKRAVIDGIVRWKDAPSPESKPWEEEDLGISPIEREIIREKVAMLGLDDLPGAAAKAARIRMWFQNEFTYTRYQTIGQARFAKPTAVGVFLTTSKQGHCEYFATAATLLLREAGVPTRYCVGYAVIERDMDREEFVIRGTHGHAWARYWDEEKSAWEDFDATPVGWLTMENEGEVKSPWLADSYQRFKEDFFLWRNRPANRTGATIVMWLIGGGTFAFVARRLWRSKVRLSKGGAPGLGDRSATPLHAIEREARRILGPRPTGMTFPAWLKTLPDHCVPVKLLGEAIALHQRLRFDPDPPPASTEKQLQALSERIRILLKRGKTSHKAFHSS